MGKEQSLYYVWLKEIHGWGPVTQRKLLKIFQTPEKIWKFANALHLEDVVDASRMLSVERRYLDALLLNLDLEPAERILKMCLDQGIEITTIEEDTYPDRMREIADMPILLYRKGTWPDLNDSVCRTIGIVGARRCTREARDRTAEISFDAVREDCVIVSGMAKGVDSYAQTSAINQGGLTVAVLGNGLDLCYPAEHDLLMRRIGEKGLLLSEYKPGTIIHKYHFPTRNRLIAALSDELYVIGAGRNSGALITADFANKYGKKVTMVS